MTYPEWWFELTAEQRRALIAKLVAQREAERAAEREEPAT